MVHEIDSISSLSTSEFILLVGHFNHAAADKPEIDPKLEGRGYSPEVLASVNKEVRAKFTPVVSLGLRFTRPLSDYKFSQFSYAMLLHENYERGLLPFEGPVSEQPAQVMDVLRTIQSLRFEQEQNFRKKLASNVGINNQGKSRTRR